MRKLTICIAVLAIAAFLSGCSNKERQIPKQSPCSCFDMVIKVG